MHNEFDRRFFLKSAAIVVAGVSLPGLAACGSSSKSGGSNPSGGGSSGSSSSGDPYNGGIAVPLYTQLPDNIPIIVGLAQGYFSAEQLTLQPVNFSQGSDVIRSVASQTHLGSSSPISGLVAHGNGFPSIRIIGACLNAPTVVYLVKKDSPIKDVGDLKGKKIGVNAPTSITTYFGRAMVKEGGLNPDSDVSLVDVKAVSDSATALDSGVVDCAWSSPPLSVQLVAQGKARVLYDAAAKHPTFTQTALFSDTGFIQSNPEVVQRFISAMAKSQAFVRSDPDTAGAIWAKALNLDKDAGIATVKSLAPHFTTKITEAGFNDNVQAAVDLGLLKAKVDRTAVVDDSFTAKVASS